MKIDQHNVFSVPIYQVPLPEFRPFNDEVIALFKQLIDSGRIEAHKYGYGYQTPTNLFFPNAYNKPYFIEILGKKFCEACERILYKTRNDSLGNYVWVNTLTVGWANIQTSEIWPGEPPWHTHLPATLSGCYYASTSSQKGEGNLQFMSPLADNIFQPPTIELEPKAGHMIIFPSFLRHRPGACPGTNRTRVALCMDSHWTVQMREQLPPEMLKRR